MAQMQREAIFYLVCLIYLMLTLKLLALIYYLMANNNDICPISPMITVSLLKLELKTQHLHQLVHVCRFTYWWLYINVYAIYFARNLFFTHFTF